MRCQVLDDNGDQCRNKALYPEKYFGDSELYDSFNEKPTWVKIEVCKKHRITKKY